VNFPKKRIKCYAQLFATAVIHTYREIAELLDGKVLLSQEETIQGIPLPGEWIH